jgi:hypothetical protein
MNQPPLALFRSNVHSQNGEDGVIAEILRRIGLQGPNNWCVEFGAWDGIHLSNTFTLVERHGWLAVYIEGDPSKFADLASTARKYPGVKAIRQMVSPSGGAGLTLDEILVQTDLPHDYDLLSVDVDSMDLELWASHTSYTPKIVVIEVNSSLMPGLLQWHAANGAQGNSISSTIAVAQSKGYTLVCHTGNAIFVRDDLIHKLGLDPTDLEFPERLFDYSRIHQPVSVRALSSIRSAGRRLPRPVQGAIRRALYGST